MRNSDLKRWFQLLDDIPTTEDSECLYDEGTRRGKIRRENLWRYFELMSARSPRVLLIGEAPGYRGTAVTGVPFMSLRELQATPGLISSRTEGDGFRPDSDSDIQWEASSAAMWRTLNGSPASVPLLWAIWPAHPHDPDNLLSNRTPTALEVDRGIGVALELARVFGVEEIIAVGKTAQRALARAGVEVAAVRHPARGGEKVFAEQLEKIMSRAGNNGPDGGI